MDAAAEEKRQEFLAAANDHIRNLRQLVEHPGWQYLRDAMKQAAENCITMMEKEKGDPGKLSLLAAELITYRKFVGAPEQMILTLSNTVAQVKVR